MHLSLVMDMATEGFADRVLIGNRKCGLTALHLRRLAIGGARFIAESSADAMVYLGANGDAFSVALFAAAQAGVPLVPLNYRLGDAQLRGLLANHPDAVVLVTEDAQHERLAQWGFAAIDAGHWLAEADRLGGDSFAPPPEPGPAAVIYTSGTTAAPKGVLINHANLMSYVLGTVEFGSASKRDASLISTPPYHIAAVANVVSNVYAGRRIVTVDRFEPAAWLDLVRAESITNAFVVPTMLARILSSGADLKVPSLRALAYGGARMPSRVIESALRRWPNVDFVNAYGLTETSSTVAVLGPGDHRDALHSGDPLVRGRLASVGRVVPGVDLQIRTAAGTTARAGEVGRIWVRGGQVSGTYAGQAPQKDGDGFFDTRDSGYLDGAGYLFVVGRADDTIIRGGENIAPSEIEEVLLGLDDIVDAAVVGVPDEEWGQRIEAVIVVRPGADMDLAAILEHAHRVLRKSKTPDRLVVWDELPRTETGKLVRRDVVSRLTGATARECVRRDCAAVRRRPG